MSSSRLLPPAFALRHLIGASNDAPCRSRTRSVIQKCGLSVPFGDEVFRVSCCLSLAISSCMQDHESGNSSPTPRKEIRKAWTHAAASITLASCRRWSSARGAPLPSTSDHSGERRPSSTRTSLAAFLNIPNPPAPPAPLPHAARPPDQDSPPPTEANSRRKKSHADSPSSEPRRKRKGNQTNTDGVRQRNRRRLMRGSIDGD